MREQLAHVVQRCLLLDPDDGVGAALLAQQRDRARHLVTDLGSFEGARAQHQHGAGIESPRRGEQVRQSLLPTDASDEEHVGPVEGNAVSLECLHRGIGPVGVGVDAVVHDMHPGGVHLRVRRQDVAAHALAHGDDRLGMGVRRCLHPGTHAVAAAELLDLPGPERLERVRRDDVRDIVEQPADVPGEIGVPRVRVEEIDSGGVAHHLQVDPERLQGGVRAGELRGHHVGLGIRSGFSEAVHVDSDERAQVRGEFTHVDACSPVDVGGPLAGEDADLHECSVGPAAREPEV